MEIMFRVRMPDEHWQAISDNVVGDAFELAQNNIASAIKVMAEGMDFDPDLNVKWTSAKWEDKS